MKSQLHTSNFVYNFLTVLFFFRGFFSTTLDLIHRSSFLLWSSNQERGHFSPERVTCSKNLNLSTTENYGSDSASKTIKNIGIRRCIIHPSLVKIESIIIYDQDPSDYKSKFFLNIPRYLKLFI